MPNEAITRMMTELASPPPRPLMLHLAIQNLTFASSLFALRNSNVASIEWKASLNRRASTLQRKLEGIDPQTFETAVDGEIRRRVAAFAAGVTRFRSAPRPDPPPPLETVFTEGTTRVLRAPAAGKPVFLIPSLINRARILDLNQKQSLVRALQAAGHDCYLVDWDGPGESEKKFSLEDYVARLERCADFVSAGCDDRPVAIGYCMGGLLTLALAHCRPDLLRGMVLLATPWDFSAMPAAPSRTLAASLPMVESLIATAGLLPVDVIQAMFASLDPGATVRKFRAFAEMTPDSPAAREFILLEDWLNDGVPLAGPVALECLKSWYIENAPANGAWMVDGRPVRPEAIDIPTFCVIPDKDMIVPPGSAKPLADLLPQVTRHRARAGHIGMVAGSRARDELIDPVCAWIAALQ